MRVFSLLAALMAAGVLFLTGCFAQAHDADVGIIGGADGPTAIIVSSAS